MADHIVRPIIRSIVRPIVRGITAGISATDYTPASTFLTVAGAWFYGWDNTDLKVNSDGTGGSVAEGGTIGRWNDRSGTGNHLSQATANIRPIWAEGKVRFFSATNGTTRNAWMRNTALATSIPRQNCSGGYVFTPTGANTSAMWDIAEAGGTVFAHMVIQTSLGYQQSTILDTGLNWTAKKMVVTFRSNASGLIFNVNGVEFTGPALTATAMTKLSLGIFNGGSPGMMQANELVLFGADVGDTEIAKLRTYLRAKVGEDDPTNVVVYFGDSMTQGAGSEMGKAYHEYITNRPNSRTYAYGRPGGWIAGPHVSAAYMVTMAGSTQTVYVVWIGVNDVNVFGQTAAATHTRLLNYCTTLKAANRKVIVCTLPDIPVTNRAVKDAYNALIVANWATYADVLVDLAADSRLADSTDTTYFTSDGVHLMDAGYAVVGELVQTAMAGLA